MSVADYEVDYSEIMGKKVECPPECGMCCLCQPEVLPAERAFFRDNYPDQLVKVEGDVPYFALALKKGRGSCVFLQNNRRCKVYDHRTTYCRQYPYHLYVSDRVQVELDLSCRGAWSGKGNDAVTEAKELIAKADKRIKANLRESIDVHRAFFSYCKEAGIYQDPSVLRMNVSENICGSISDMSIILLR